MNGYSKVLRALSISEVYNPRHAVSSDIMHYALFIKHLAFGNCLT